MSQFKQHPLSQQQVYETDFNSLKPQFVQNNYNPQLMPAYKPPSKLPQKQKKEKIFEGKSNDSSSIPWKQVQPKKYFVKEDEPIPHIFVKYLNRQHPPKMLPTDNLNYSDIPKIQVQVKLDDQSGQNLNNQNKGIFVNPDKIGPSVKQSFRLQQKSHEENESENNIMEQSQKKNVEEPYQGNLAEESEEQNGFYPPQEEDVQPYNSQINMSHEKGLQIDQISIIKNNNDEPNENNDEHLRNLRELISNTPIKSNEHSKLQDSNQKPQLNASITSSQYVGVPANLQEINNQLKGLHEELLQAIDSISSNQRFFTKPYLQLVRQCEESTQTILETLSISIISHKISVKENLYQQFSTVLPAEETKNITKYITQSCTLARQKLKILQNYKPIGVDDQGYDEFINLVKSQQANLKSNQIPASELYKQAQSKQIPKDNLQKWLQMQMQKSK